MQLDALSINSIQALNIPKHHRIITRNTTKN